MKQLKMYLAKIQILPHILTIFQKNLTQFLLQETTVVIKMELPQQKELYKILSKELLEGFELLQPHMN